MTPADKAHIEEIRATEQAATQALNSPSFGDFRKEQQRVDAIGKLERSARNYVPYLLDLIERQAKRLERLVLIEQYARDYMEGGTQGAADLLCAELESGE